jgi:hypothetical protein
MQNNGNLLLLKASVVSFDRCSQYLDQVERIRRRFESTDERFFKFVEEERGNN